LLRQTVGCKPPRNVAVKRDPSSGRWLCGFHPYHCGQARGTGSEWIVSTTTYNSQFPGPLLRFKEGQAVTIDINDQTDTPEQLHWHGQFLPTDVDGAAEEGTELLAFLKA
jgi:hypothetical protein